MADKPPESSNAPPPPGRGWNDPPMLPPLNGMNPSTGAIKKTGLNLNKRVAFPMSGGVPQPSRPMINSSAPPMIPQMVLLPKQVDENSGAAGSAPENQAADENLDLQLTMDNFDKILSSTANFGGRATVQRELQSIKSMWEKEQLNDDVCLSIQKLSKALVSKDTARAQDHLSSISSSLLQRNDTIEWATALRSLVNYFALAAVYNETTTAEVN